MIRYETVKESDMGEHWNTIDTAPAEEVVLTKIDDDDGVRNVQALKRSGRLWFVPDGSMYVYYTPTHWRRDEPQP